MAECTLAKSCAERAGPRQGSVEQAFRALSAQFSEKLQPILRRRARRADGAAHVS